MQGGFSDLSDNDDRLLFMQFNYKPICDEESEAMRHRIQKIKNFFWQRMSDMVLGPDHEYVYLKRLMKRLKAYH